MKGRDVNVGIVSAAELRFTFNAPYSSEGKTFEGPQHITLSRLDRDMTFFPLSPSATFTLDDVVIGVGFHWQRHERQNFQGILRLVRSAEGICAVNTLPVEDYLKSVIASEMRATSSIELLKAHAVCSRSWLLSHQTDHKLFDVCADDHCQRYQGIARADNPHVAEAVDATRGEVLTSGNDICDTRYSKCCGGVTEEFQFCWEGDPKPYLVSVACPFCDTHDKMILRQVLNDYDLITSDFHDWTVSFSVDEITANIRRRSGRDIGSVTSLIPLRRGLSGRICLLRVIGTEGEMTIGKELEIRRSLSRSCLYSSWFDIDRQPGRFILHGHGWGHGVGLCQIGAAVMAERGYDYRSILNYYYKNTTIEQR